MEGGGRGCSHSGGVGEGLVPQWRVGRSGGRGEGLLP